MHECSLEIFDYGAHQVHMSKLRSTPVGDTRPKRRNSSVPKLQCGSHRTEDLYVTSPGTSAAC
jgi:hypothetical protein